MNSGGLGECWVDIRFLLETPFLLLPLGFMSNLSDLIEVTDPQGQQQKITRGEFLNHMKQASSQNWENLEAIRHISQNFLQAGFLEEALVHAERAVALSGGHIPDLYWRAAALAENGRLEDSAAAFLEIQEDAAYPRDIAQAMVGLARVRVRQGNLAEAEELLFKAVETDLENPQFMLAVYGFYNEQDKPEEGLAKVQEMLGKYSESPTPHRALAQIAATTGNLDALKVHIETGLNLAASNAALQQDLLAEFTFLLGQVGQPQAIISLLEPNLQHVGQPFALMNLARAYQDTGQVAKARQLLTAMREQAPQELHQMLDARLAALPAEDSTEA